ncbi:transporter suffix domain-containing protein [Microscilla marina]|uniref:Transporter suffix domain-containing protein n=1 Tax=Microscilla marina ATCC 23134 TaxID=313606 RepID=A1ZK32_MICM2|nr:transporter suffix domain-containing protein [Microscilla marina]EAY29058.1 hypothetical protein M23134_02248 [Microscilla marina ATCC 23134]
MKKITTYFKDNFSPQKQKKFAITLILFSLVPLILGIVTFASAMSPQYKTLLGSGLFLIGDIVYYVGIALLGKTFYEKYQRFFRRSYWARKYKMLVS